MSGSDIGNAAERLAPGGPGSGEIKFTFTSSASTAQQIRPAADAKGAALYISVKVTAACHLVFGSASVGDPTNAQVLFEPSDSWQDMMLMPGQSHFKVKGDSGGGDIYIWPSGH